MNEHVGRSAAQRLEKERVIRHVSDSDLDGVPTLLAPEPGARVQLRRFEERRNILLPTHPPPEVVVYYGDVMATCR